MEIHKAILNAMNDIEAIGKDKKNQQQGFSFRGIDDMYNRLHPILAKHRIYSTPEVIHAHHEERQTKSGSHLIYRILTIKYTFYTDDGSSVSLTVIGEGMDSGDKASNKAMAIAHKYALLQLFAIPTEDAIDPDATTPPPSVPRAPQKASKGFNALGATKMEIMTLLKSATDDGVYTEEDFGRLTDMVAKIETQEAAEENLKKLKEKLGAK